MIFTVRHTDRHKNPCEPLEVETLEDFIAWVTAQDDSVIVSTKHGLDLEIYDDYRE